MIFESFIINNHGFSFVSFSTDQTLFAEINQIILKINFIHILLTFMYLVALYQKTEL